MTEILVAAHKPAELAVFTARANYAVGVPMHAAPHALAPGIVLYLALWYIALVRNKHTGLMLPAHFDLVGFVGRWIYRIPVVV